MSIEAMPVIDSFAERLASRVGHAFAPEFVAQIHEHSAHASELHDMRLHVHQGCHSLPQPLGVLHPPKPAGGRLNADVRLIKCASLPPAGGTA